MFESTVELIIQAASNSLVIFCFCNLIIVMILMGSKPGSDFGQESGIPRSMVTRTRAMVKEDVPAKPSLDGNKKPSLDESTADGKVSIALEEPTGGDDEEESGNDNEEAEDEDELRRRVEEFISKVNHGWKTELSGRRV
ncbi:TRANSMEMBRANE PROTEIN [Salix purpurea]|uniref:TRANSMEMBRANE PROTEIN n=1 Tax=Salix purpurea TaxID=77065 RepID=A0A9Q0VFX4_SALPP|nr:TRANSMEMBRANE PROTEIN [Salix purpurea]